MFQLSVVRFKITFADASKVVSQSWMVLVEARPMFSRTYTSHPIMNRPNEPEVMPNDLIWPSAALSTATPSKCSVGMSPLSTSPSISAPGAVRNDRVREYDYTHTGPDLRGLYLITGDHLTSALSASLYRAFRGTSSFGQFGGSSRTRMARGGHASTIDGR
ncbi:hypothetical protein N7495_002066 [Penicillium taxi]|uniref:uncharacterized protein n=1 Tax=Penicillium taxi TaxID=168475 RepID=UPI00254562E6|nr:uncharacterized protein N7495_002066 [Penicillium taxi]KAJ5901538.1 hypothetical protein N7495_002066 [Penicillium taxi]